MLAPPADDLVHALKYEGWPELAPLMASAMASLSVPNEGGRALVIPVPTTAKRLRTRGYNQAGLLAESYASTRALPLEELLVRAGADTSQTSLHPSERRANVGRRVLAGRGGVGPCWKARTSSLSTTCSPQERPRVKPQRRYLCRGLRGSP